MGDMILPKYYYSPMASKRIQHQIEPLLDQAEEAITNGTWPTVDSRARSILAIDPANSDATVYLAAAGRALNGSTPAANGDSTNSDRLSKIFSRANDAIFVLDPRRGEIMDVNPKACEMSDYSREELLSIGISAVYSDELPKFLSFVNHVDQDQYGWTGEITCYTKKGKALPAEISASTVELDSVVCDNPHGQVPPGKHLPKAGSPNPRRSSAGCQRTRSIDCLAFSPSGS